MPCVCDDYGETESDQKLLLDKLTRMLCSVLTTISQLPEFDSIGFDSEVVKWWKKHQKADAARKKIESEEKKKKRLAAKALNKLTKEEKEALTYLRIIKAIS